jgi:DNA-binding HxlR family transcriptional regulator
MKGYGSFCPVAKAAEILTERWTLLVLRELLLGSCHFNQLRRGIPQMSQTLLAKRLQTLEQAGLVSRCPCGDGRWQYRPTQAAEELGPIIDAVGNWGQRWARSRLVPNELHAGRLMWNMRRSFNVKNLPRDFVLYVEIADARPKYWWFVVRNREVDLCWDDPGHQADISLYASLLPLVKIFMGDLSLLRASELGEAEINGPKDLIQGMPAWFPRSKHAELA